MAETKDQKDTKEEPAKFRYFSPGPTSAVARYGTDTLIGATRTPDGYVIDPEAVVAIPVDEVRRYGKEYRSHLKSQSLVERTAEDFEAAKAARRQKASDARAQREKNQADAKAATEKAQREEVGPGGSSPISKEP